jgi:DNA ligase (NAD+)
MLTLADIDLQNLTPQALGELLIEAKKAYYTSGKPLMDDATYDTLENILHQKHPYHRFFQKVGTPNFDTGFLKKKHLIPMGSQNKVNRLADLIHYFELKKIPQKTSFVVQPKCDGLSLEIVYQQGRVVEAITRGDGFTGDVITQNVVQMQNFCPQLKLSFTGSIRFEIVVTKSDFDKLNSLTPNSSPQDLNYSNPRNAASGISQRLDGQYSLYCSLFAVDMIQGSNSQLSTEMDQIEFLRSLGVTTVDSYLCPTFDQIEAIYQRFLLQDRQDYPFDIDGLVIKINDLQLQQSLGQRDNRPKGQVAYKFPSLTNQTQIKNITWQVGPMGSITPVAQVEPIELAGAVITFASLGNYDLVSQKGINIGDIVQISRRGDVIPHIEEVITKVNPGHAPVPARCPSCQTLLIQEDKYLKCPNISGCLAQMLGSLRLFCATLDIKGISDKTIEKLYHAHKIKLPGDFYRLAVADFANLEGLGDKSGANIIKEIQSKRELTVKQVFDAASIPHFSAARIQQLLDAGFNTPQKILQVAVSDLTQIPGFKTTLAQKIVSGLQARRPYLESILSQVQVLSTTPPSTSSLSGQTFVITGDLARPRKDVIQDIESHGGKVSSTVSTKTSYLVTNETQSNSSKFQTAQKLGTLIITESQLYQLLTQTN